jgi:hypothetical protein
MMQEKEKKKICITEASENHAKEIKNKNLHDRHAVE